MSGLFKSKKETTQKTEIDPRVYNEVLQNLQLARQISQIPFEPYRGLMIAPFTRDYMTGEAMTRAIAGEGGFVPEVEAAARQAAGLMGYTPQQVMAAQVAPGTVVERVGAQQLPTQFATRDVGAALAGGPMQVGAQQVGAQFTPQQIVSQAVGQALRGGPERVGAGAVGAQFAAPTISAAQISAPAAARDVTAPGAVPTAQAASFLGQDLAPYMNPYQQAVIEAGLSDIERAEAAQRQQIGAQATAARAFGGSRQAVQEGIAAGEAARERNRFIAEQRARAFQEATALREADVARQQQAALANQAAAQNVMQLAQTGQISNQERDLRLSQLGITAEQANQAAAMEAARANQQAAQQAQQLGLTAQQFNVQQQMQAQQLNQQAVQDYMRMGLTAEQANQQAALDAARANQQAGLQAGQLGLTAQQANQEAALRAQLANQQAVQQYMQMGLTAEQANQQAMMDAQRLGLTAGQANQEAALRAALANQQAGLTGQQMTQQQQQFNAEQMMRAQLANQQAGLTGAQFQLSAGRQLGDLGQQALQNRYGAAAAMTGLGSAQQQLMQQYLNAQREEFMRRVNFPMQQLAIAQGAVSASPYNVTQYGKTVGTPSIMQMIGQAAGTAMGMGWGGIGGGGGGGGGASFGSDENMKRNIKLIKNPLDKVNRLRGIEFEWEDGYGSDEYMDEGGKRDMSVSAQDVIDVMPEAVSERDSDGMMEVGTPQMIGLLTGAVQELDKKIEGKKRRRKSA